MNRVEVLDVRDHAARSQALDTSRSFLVQAPAGSGKTELLTRRFLKLLAEVEEPEQVVAVTFTRAAAAEMRHRVIAAIDPAGRLGEEKAATPEERQRVQFAENALENSTRRGWHLLEQPQRLNIQTIDSLNLRLSRQMPLRARLGGTLKPTENAAPLYRKAARKTFERLGGGDLELNQALESLLLLRDSNLRHCETLLANMLTTRDQWMRAIPASGEVDWPAVRTVMEAPFQREIRRALSEAHALLSSSPAIVGELLDLANYACGAPELQIDILDLAGSDRLPPLDSPRHWNCLVNLLLTKDDDWLVNANKNHGFPTGNGKASFEARQKQRRKELISDLRHIPGLLDLMVEIRGLPAWRYTEEQWRNLQQMFVLLRQAAHDLALVFSDYGAVDFLEVAKGAREVLDGSADSSRNEPGERIMHLLVDEFQDTSRFQHELIAALLRDWRQGDGRTFFLVGDPMQSIYMFRHADVELFRRIGRTGVAIGDGSQHLETLRLTTNFRSNEILIDSLNDMFERVFPQVRGRGGDGVEFLPSTAGNRERPPGAFEIHPGFVNEKKGGKGREIGTAPDRTQHDETTAVLAVIRRHLAAIEAARSGNREYTVAVLARAKNHLLQIASALRDDDIPFRAVELEYLGERPEILDLQSLTRALLHPMDRIAWLAVLRAPWCGLELRDLHLLCGTDARQSSGGAIRRQIEEHLHLLGEESRQRVLRVTAVLDAAIRDRRGHSSFSSWIERTWHSLGGRACVDATGLENALTFFRMLDQVTPDGIAATGEEMDNQLSRLFAVPDPSVREYCGVQLMTIHKAKGLGFNVVLLPGLHRRSGRDPLPLIRYLEKITEAGSEVLLAPIDGSGEETSALNRWVRKQKENLENEERKRLLYVACTRARDEVHLFATATVTDGEPGCMPGTLLHTAWPALQGAFRERLRLQTASAPNLSGGPSRLSSNVLESTGILGAVAASASRSTLHRLPLAAKLVRPAASVIRTVTNLSAAAQDSAGNTGRPRGSWTSRALGTTMHALLEMAAHLLAKGASERALDRLNATAIAIARAEGLPPTESESCARQAAKALEMALADPHGAWILSAHPESQTESSWTGILNGVSQTLRIDRSFLAGAEPLSEGRDFLWIIDYKAANHGEAGLTEFLESEKLQYAEQLEAYGHMMRLARGMDQQFRLGLYYPLLQRLLWWRG